MGSHAIVFLTHIESERIFAHFERLREEIKGLLSPILCIHNPDQSIGKRILKGIRGPRVIPTPYISVGVKSGALVLPNQFAQMRRLDRSYNTGFTDLAYMPALLSERMREYDYIWLVENDVDFAGNWREFFLSTMQSDADLLSTYVYSRNDNSSWEHWSWFQTPSEVSFDLHTSSFNPIVRFSRRLVSIYERTVQNVSWQGHTEALIPTIARHNGLTICDLGGSGDFCPEQWRDRHYHNPLVEDWNNREPGRGTLPHLMIPPFWLSDGGEGRPCAATFSASTMGSTFADKVTFIHGPVVQSAYFHEKPTRYLERNVLYHPVKVVYRRSSIQLSGAASGP